MNPDLLLDSYDYNLPEELIAARPATERDHSRLLVYNEETDEVSHRKFFDLPEILSSHDTLVFNQSRVFPCRLEVFKSSGGKAEVFFLQLEKTSAGLYPVLIRSNGRKKIGDAFRTSDNFLQVIIEGIEEDYFLVSLDDEVSIENYLEEKGRVPIPPYIRKGEDSKEDKESYQTVFAKDKGSVAAPTAGLHFTDGLLEKLDKQGLKRAFLSLHVGMGTFKPVSSQSLQEHKMHREKFFIDDENLKVLNSSGRLIAVGTTSLRVLESIKTLNGFRGTPAWEETDIFIHPGKDVKSIDGLITNFHLPKSSLIMLVSAIIGREKTFELYELAIKEKYRFFSYGDAMLILRKGKR